MIAIQLPTYDERIAELRQLWEKAKVSLTEEAVTYGIANDLGMVLFDKGKYEEAKVFFLATLEGQRRVLGEKHKKTLDSMYNMGILLNDVLKDYEGALGYYQQARKVQEKVLGKTHPDTLSTIMNMAVTYMDGLKDFTKAEQMYRQALDGFEKSLGKDHEDTKRCARNLAILLFQGLKDKTKTRELVEEFPHLLEEGGGLGVVLSRFIQ